MALWAVFWEMMQKPSMGDVVCDVLMLMVPLWIAVAVGVLVGWAWKPTWANLCNKRLLKLEFKASAGGASNESESSPAESRSFASIPSLSVLKLQLPSCVSWYADDVKEKDTSPTTNGDINSSENEKDVSGKLSDKDLEYLHRLVEEKDGGPAWIQMMDRSTKTMSYQAWRRDPENGPPQYRSRTVFDNATPEMVRDFFWDDEFRSKWDDMLIHASTLEECSKTGTMLVKWVRKFPFFCSDREYVIGRRIWASGRTYYCVTKGVPCSAVPRCNKPRRVDLYYSSWCIRPVESRSGDGQLSACEVLLFHYEDMGIPWEIAKLGVRQGMWGAVKKIEPGLRAYQKERAADLPLSRCAHMAQITSKVSEDDLRSLENSTPLEISETEKDSSEKPSGRTLPKLLVVGGAIVVACSLDRGLVTKALIFGVARRFANLGRRL